MLHVGPDELYVAAAATRLTLARWQYSYFDVSFFTWYCLLLLQVDPSLLAMYGNPDCSGYSHAPIVGTTDVPTMCLYDNADNTTASNDTYCDSFGNDGDFSSINDQVSAQHSKTQPAVPETSIPAAPSGTGRGEMLHVRIP